MREMPHDLGRFLDAQAATYPDVVAELRRGRKVSHWMWFIFPQLAGLGHSSMSRRFAIKSLEEARAYLDDPVLGIRLRKSAQALLAISGKSAADIFGWIDAIKLRSSMTLFHLAAPDEELFVEVLARYYAGVADPVTEALLA